MLQDFTASGLTLKVLARDVSTMGRVRNDEALGRAACSKVRVIGRAQPAGAELCGSLSAAGVLPRGQPKVAHVAAFDAQAACTST